MWAAAPANAVVKPINESMYLEFVGPADGCDLGGGFRTWVGTVAIDGVTYVWADFSTQVPWFEGKCVHNDECWTIFDIQGDLLADSCNEALALMAGADTGGVRPA